MRSLGIYIHIPFCIQKCNYCDFCSYGGQDVAVMEAYVAEVCRRIVAYEARCREYRVDTVYFGGGTPTLLGVEQIGQLMDCLRRTFCMGEDCEVTMECNPATADEEKLRGFLSVGINRLSIGLQSANDEELRVLGRLHTFSDFCETVEQARAAGFCNISADLMHGIPDQTLSSYEETLMRVLPLELSHISAYGLKLEQGTPFWNHRSRLALPDEDAECAMYEMTGKLLAAAGYRQYEISNYAKPDMASRHNLRYWLGEEYLGFGVAAHSDFGGARFANSRDLSAFLCGEEIECERVCPDEEERRNEYVMLRMRLADGIDYGAYEARFGESFSARYGAKLARFAAAGLLRNTEGGIAFTQKGFLLSNTVLSEILDFSENA